MSRSPRTRSRSRTDEMLAFSNYEALAQDPNMDGKAEDEAEWEDEDAVEYSVQPMRPVSPSGSRMGTMRKRRRQVRSTVTKKQPSVPPSPRPQRVIKEAAAVQKPTPQTEPIINIQTEDVMRGAVEGAKFTGRYTFDVVHLAVRLLRYPLPIILALWILAYIIGSISHTFHVAFSPLCILPGISSTAACRWKHSPPPRSGPRWADYPRLIEVQSKSFDQLLDESIGGNSLSLDVKKAEIAVKDLVVVVKYSDLKAKDTLARHLTEFAYDAQKTGRGLQRLDAKIAGAVDNVMAVNDHALHLIEDAQNKEFSILSLARWIPSKREAAKQEVMTGSFEEAMNVVSVNMERLILEAEQNIIDLNKLEEALHSMQDILGREDSTISKEKQLLLEELWTKLGGNKKKLKSFEDHLVVLRHLGTYKQQAFAHVNAALMTLRAMSADMDDLRERVAMPELVGNKIPLEVHVQSIKMGIQRLHEGRMRARRLENQAINRVLSESGVNLDE